MVKPLQKNQAVIRTRHALRCAILSGVMVVVGLSGCTSSRSSSTQSVTQQQTRQPVQNGQYRVQRGETLYAIAFRYGWDWRELAQHNGIGEPYVIYPGQVIRFGGSRGATAAPYALNPQVNNSRSSDYSSRTQQIPGQATSVNAANNNTKTVVASGVKSASGWMWPSSGQVIGVYASSGSLNKGIDIAGQLGQPVLAASDGSVVYAGSGLRGYGELIIIKHNDTYVSAYGHNSKLLVREGQRVSAGQKIAEMGSTGTDRVKLHFEIRRQGKPVDPQQYLPRR